MKIRVKLKYAIWVYETHEVEIDGAEDVEILNEDGPCEFTSEETRTEKIEGDCLNDTREESWEEISALDQIVEALVDHPIHMVACDDPYCIDGTSSDGRKDDGSKWEEGAWGDCEKCDGTGKIRAEAVSDNAE